MSSSKQDGTAAAAQQLGSMSLGESAERKDNETEPNTKNGTPTKKLCSACGKKSDTLMKCRACKCVWYCDKDCQNKHWKEHKQECMTIKKELDKRGGKLDLGNEKDLLGPLPDLPPREECPICMCVLPIHERLTWYSSCCGNIVCGGCGHQHQMKRGEEGTCAFCREPFPRSDEEALGRLRTRVERNDPQALNNLAMHYIYGQFGLSMDRAKGIDLLRQSAGLGCTKAQAQLGDFHHGHVGSMGLEQNEEAALKYFKEAAEGGRLLSRHNLGCVAGKNGDDVAAMRHWRMSASGGYRKSMRALIECFEEGSLHHNDLAETLQAMYRARAEIKSDDRDKFIAYLKRTGKYREEYEN